VEVGWTRDLRAGPNAVSDETPAPVYEPRSVSVQSPAEGAWRIQARAARVEGRGTGRPVARAAWRFPNGQAEKVVTTDDVRAEASQLPRSYEAIVRRRAAPAAPHRARRHGLI
jgi:uncharacterized lipoprotein YmbA